MFSLFSSHLAMFYIHALCDFGCRWGMGSIKSSKVSWLVPLTSVDFAATSSRTYVVNRYLTSNWKQRRRKVRIYPVFIGSGFTLMWQPPRAITGFVCPCVTSEHISPVRTCRTENSLSHNAQTSHSFITEPAAALTIGCSLFQDVLSRKTADACVCVCPWGLIRTV